MVLTLVVRSGDGKIAPRLSFDAPRVVIGRGEGCEVQLPDPSVSHRHASIRQRGTEYVVMDEGSSNGTFVGPVRLSPQAPRIVRHGELLRVGRVWLEVCVEQGPPTQNAPVATRELALSLVADALAAEGSPSAPRVRVIEGPGKGAELVLSEIGRPYAVGRAPTSDLPVDDPDLSRRHVELLRRAEKILIRDLGSKNGSLLGEVRIAPKEEVLWPKDQVLSMGATRLTYEDPVKEALLEIERAADERIKDGEVIAPPTGGPDVPRVELPRRSDRPAPVRRSVPVDRPPGWTLADGFVAFLAVVVIALSVAAIVWLVKAG
jgi:pSer/pThr/pTyr-binding forkhead associated (FHA) protein